MESSTYIEFGRRQLLKIKRSMQTTRKASCNVRLAARSNPHPCTSGKNHVATPHYTGVVSMCSPGASWRQVAIYTPLGSE